MVEGIIKITNLTMLEQGINVRSATEEDFVRVMEIDRLSFSAPWIENFFKSALKDIFLVLEKKREIVGYVITCVCHDLEKAVILRIAVHPDHRGEGAAGILIRTCLDMLIQKDIGVVELDVELISRGAIKLYEKFGFKIENVLVFPSDFPGDEETFYVMRLELPRSEEEAVH
jgi:ribosomal-protein-alanine N-acetyltransferase